MTDRKLSRLEQVELREVWNHEAHDFTNWLVEPDNMLLLGDALWTEISLIRTEADVGRYNVDILAEEVGSWRRVIIENQLEDTDHDHLWKIITYASWYDAEIIVWVVKDAREEHKRAIEWLNEHTDEKIGFFLLQIQVWRIGDSAPAPRFDVVVSPNEWAKITKNAGGDGEVSETKSRQLRFWTELKEYANGRKPWFVRQKPLPHFWYAVRIGSSEGHIVLKVDTKDGSVSCELLIPDNKELFRIFSEERGAIETKLGWPAEWLDNPKNSRIVVRKKSSDVFGEENQKWLLDSAVLFESIFRERLSKYKKES